MAEQTTVAVLGAGGVMGLGMAKNLAEAGFDVSAWNRTREKAEPLAEHGAVVVDDVVTAVREADVVITMLFDAEATLDLMTGEDGALDAMPEGAVWLQMATLGEAGTASCITAARRAGVAFVDAPVSGTKGPAADGTLVILASGEDPLRARVDPLLDAMGKRTVWLGEAGAGSQMKLVVNAWLVSVVQGLAETMALASGSGVDPAAFLDVIGGGPLDAPFAQMKGKKILQEDWELQFGLDAGAKDARLALDLAHAHGMDLPTLETIADRMTAAESEHGGKDVIATYLDIAPGGPGGGGIAGGDAS